MNNTFPLISIITPVYNRASYLDETITSVIDQDYPNVEYIVLDDGSTDNSLEIIKKYCDKISWSTHSNMGETLTVNKGLEMAHGEIIGIVNSDDPLLPKAISTIVQFMVSYPEMVVAYPDWIMVDVVGKFIQEIKTFEYDYINMLRWHHCIPGPGTFFRKSLLNKIHGRDPQFRFVGDFDFWLRAGLIGQFGRVPATLATFRWHSGGSSSKDKGILMAEEHVRLVEKIFNLPNLPPQVLAIKKEAFSSAYYIGGVVSGNDAPEIKKKFFMQALKYAPAKYLGEYHDRLSTISEIYQTKPINYIYLIHSGIKLLNHYRLDPRLV